MYIGEVVKRTGASQKAIRLYESLGLLGEIQRTGAYRVYTKDNVRQIDMIRKAQSLGFRLSELDPVLRAGRRKPDWGGLLRQLEQKRASIRSELERLNRLEAQLAQIIDEIGACASHDSPLDPARCGAPDGRRSSAIA